MSSAWVEPRKLAKSVYDTLNNTEKMKIKANLSSYGKSIFKNFNYSEEQSQEFIKEISKLLNGD